jgi:hypothetical protein
MNDIIFVCDNLEKWMKDESAPDVDFSNKLMGPKIRKDPLGAVLVIGYDICSCTRPLFLKREKDTNK